jgi:hypothetical protein
MDMPFYRYPPTICPGLSEVSGGATVVALVQLQVLYLIELNLLIFLASSVTI